jgi:hypothetical protein
VFTTFTAPVPGGKRAALRETIRHVDSGAAASICSQKLVQQLGLNDAVEPLPESHRVRFLTTASGEFRRIAGTVTLSFTLQDGKEITHDCLVVPKYDWGMLLGNDFLLTKRAAVDYSDRSLKLLEGDKVCGQQRIWSFRHSPGKIFRHASPGRRLTGGNLA